MATTRHRSNVNPAGRMAARSFEVAGSSLLLAELVRTYMLQTVDSAEVSMGAADEELPGAGVVVREAGSGRWLFLAVPVLAEDWVDGVLRAVAGGATAVLSLESGALGMGCALEALTSGRLYLAPDVAAELMGRPAPAAKPQLEAPLTDRERQVLQLVAEGYSNAEIADALGISKNTVRTHLRSLAVKMDAANRTRLLTKAHSLGLSGGPAGRQAKQTRLESDERKF